MIALAEMWPNLAMAAVILIVGTCFVVAMSRRNAGHGNKSRSWIIPLVSLFAGPAIALVWWAADVFIFNPDMYPRDSDAWALLPPIVLIGAFVGVVASVVFAIALNLRLRSDG